MPTTRTLRTCTVPQLFCLKMAVWPSHCRARAITSAFESRVGIVVGKVPRTGPGEPDETGRDAIVRTATLSEENPPRRPGRRCRAVAKGLHCLGGACDRAPDRSDCSPDGGGCQRRVDSSSIQPSEHGRPMATRSMATRAASRTPPSWRRVDHRPDGCVLQPSRCTGNLTPEN